MAVNKHRAMLAWLEGCPALPGTLLFDFLGEHNGSVTISPLATEAWVKRYIGGSGTKQYTFQAQMMLAVSDSTDSTNVDNMGMLDAVGAWIEAQQAAGNFPDFGPNCSGYNLALSDNMPSLEMTYENGNAKYGILATVQYYEENNRL